MTNHDKLAEIRAAHVKAAPNDFCDMDGQWWPCDTSIVLAHIDALTAAVEGLPIIDWDPAVIGRESVLAILRGKR
jgi:hypothetical protein